MYRFTILTLVTLTLAGCGKDDSTAQNTTEPASPTWVLTSAPDGALSISEAKTSAKEGDHIILRGRIGGRNEPLTEGSPVFTMMDLAISHCGENPDDNCSTPWDYCCETPETITTNSATVQIVDALGQPITDSPTIQGLAALDEVIIVGIVAPRPNQDVLTVRANGIYRVGE